ncbi:MAG TPA: YncE family protein [Bryobacteraceae bacterium]|nr:YncE family protein [Bryobacteraceae bacterium]
MSIRWWALGVLAVTSASAAAARSAVLLVLNKASNELAIVDPVSHQVLGRVPTGLSPHEVTASADGRLAFVSNYGTGEAPGNSISVIQIEPPKEVRRFLLDPMSRPHGIWFAGGRVYFTAEANKLIGSYDPAASRVNWLLGTGQNSTHMVLVSPDGNRIFTANIGSDSITEFERTGGPMAWNGTVIPVGKGPEGMDLSPDGRELWTAHSGDGGVSIIDAAAKRVVQTLRIGTKRSNRLKFSPDGRLVLVSDMGGGELVVLDARARKEVKRLSLGRSPEGILMPPGESRAYVAVAGENHVAILDLKTLTVAGQIETGSGPDGLAWAQRK